ncbi:MAG TPA: hypothetical protein VKR59_14955 [Terriglobales bacterium]|nr:hypothetical protein [Terriglobales bacterium]
MSFGEIRLTLMNPFKKSTAQTGEMQPILDRVSPVPVISPHAVPLRL